MTTFFSEAATVSSRQLLSRCSEVGFTMKPSSSVMPMNTPPIGPFHGISEMERAMDAPIIAVISGEQS